MNVFQNVIDYPDFNHCIFRDGFVFTSICDPANILDAIVVRSPMQCDCWTPKKSLSNRSLDEHIAFINSHKLEKAMIIAEDISFLVKCPTLKYLEIIPADTSLKFDYSPLYEMPEIIYLSCKTLYGGSSEKYHTTVDYSKTTGVKKLQIEGKGHFNYGFLHDLDELKIYEDKVNSDFQHISQIKNLKRLWITQSRLKSLRGLNTMWNLQELCIDSCRTLCGIGELVHVSDSLRSFSFHNCPNVRDFSVLQYLKNLEFLHLHGNNELPNLGFLDNMPNLKVFTFSMPVKSCDLRPCLRIPYTDVSRGKRGYNLGNKDLKKILPTTPFEIYHT